MARKNKGSFGGRKLRRVTDEEWIGGVCAGFAYWLGFPAWLIRLFWFLAVCSAGVGLVAYVLLWIFMPKWDCTPADFEKVTGA